MNKNAIFQLYATVQKAYLQKSNKNAQLHAKGLWDKLKEKKDFPTTGKDRKKRQRISYEGKDDGTFHPCD